jgi:DNA invertase Pin-like site-specific DNA recombinase
MKAENDTRKVTVLFPQPNTAAIQSEEKLKVAAYCRVSTNSEEQLSSYRAQLSYYEKLIKENEAYCFAGIYADEGVSAFTNKRRIAFSRMIDDAKDGKIDRIITKSLSRFGRNTLECLKTLRLLKEYTVDVFFEKENIHSLQYEGEIMITLLSAVAQQESIALSENVKWGKRRKFEKGDISVIPWKNITGYDKDKNGEVVIIENEAVIIRYIFHEFLRCKGTNEIARELGQKFHLNKTSERQILNVLNNEKFKGDVRFSLMITQDPFTKKQVSNKGQAPQYYVKDSHPAIVTPEIWELANMELNRQRKFCSDHHMQKYHHQENQVTSLPLTGRIVCGNCGHAFKIKTSNRLIEKGQRYYGCIKHRTGYLRETGPDNCCNGTRIFVEDAHQLFINAWNHLVDHPEEIKPSDDALKDYRAGEIKRLLSEYGKIDEIKTELVRQTLDHISVGNGKADVIFLFGVRD